MPYHPPKPPFELYWCPLCQTWFKKSHVASMIGAFSDPKLGWCEHTCETRMTVLTERRKVE
jgi:hypothetical protein